jgi:hypothetical protein
VILALAARESSPTNFHANIFFFFFLYNKLWTMAADETTSLLLINDLEADGFGWCWSEDGK